MSKKLPYYKMYPKDFDADEKVRRLDCREAGLYLFALNHAWNNDGLPGDDSEAGKVLKVSVRDFRDAWPSVKKCFIVCEDGRLRNTRQEEERSKAKEKSTKAADAAETRWSNADKHANALDEPMRTHSERIENAMPRAYESESESVITSKKPEKSKESDGWFDSEFWPIWPVKQNRTAAKEAARKLKVEEYPAVMAGVRAQSARIAAMERPIHASTWLNKRRWEDEVQLSMITNGNGRVLPEYKPGREVPRYERPVD